MLFSMDSTCLLKLHTNQSYMSSHTLMPLLCDVFLMVQSDKSCLYTFTRCPVCVLVPVPRPQEKARERERVFFFPVHLKNSSIVLCRSPHCCGNVWPSWRTLCTSTDGLCTGLSWSAHQHAIHDTQTHVICFLLLCLRCVSGLAGWYSWGSGLCFKVRNGSRWRLGPGFLCDV